ncbi:MAG: DUF1292 domain-containing protein [Eubacterium sp.]|nr:DUF1292 domain-containing protein [Eubacterium sp.]
MGRNNNQNENNGYDAEEMTVDLELDDGTSVTCAVITILTVSGQEYIALLPLDDQGENTDGEVWFYRYSENPDDPNEEPELGYIDDDDEYEAVADAFDEYLDSAEFDELVDEDD